MQLLVKIRGLVAVLLRTSLFIKTNNMFSQISTPLQSRVKQALLQIIATESVARARHQLIDTTCELAGLIFNDAEKQAEGSSKHVWPEIFAFIFQAAQHAQPSHRDTGLRIFTRLSPFLGSLTSGPQLGNLKQIFARGLVDPDVEVRMSALSATISFIEMHFDEQTKKEVQLALPKMAEIITSALKAHSEENARAAIGMFVELAESEPLFFRPQIVPMCQLMVEIISTTKLEDVTRQYALEFLVTLCEQKPGMMAKVPNFFPKLVQLCVALLLEVEDDQDWFTRGADSVEVSNVDVAAECLDRLCLCLTGKTMVPIVRQMLPSLLGSKVWKERAAGLQVLCIMGEGCNEEISEDLPSVIRMVVPFFQDPHPRVRFGSMNTLGQLCLDFGPGFQEDYHAVILPALLTQMEAEKIPKVLSHICATTVNWCNGLDPVHLLPYAPRWMTGLQGILQQGHIIAQEQALMAVAAMAECMQEKFTPYYDGFMPLCKHLLGRASAKEHREIQGKCVDVITVMAASVGAQKFAADGAQILPIMVQMQKTKMDDDDPMIGHLMQGWARISKCLGPAFVEFLPVVMPSTLASAAKKPDVQIATNDNHEKLQNEGIWDFRTVANESFACKTSTMEEKSMATNMLFCYANDLKEHFMPYIVDTTNIVIPLLDFYLDGPVRSSAAGVIPKLLECVVAHVKKSGGGSVLTELWLRVFPTLLESINAEPDVRVLVDKVECLKDCLTALGKGCLDVTQLQAALRVFMGVVLSVLERKHRLVARQEEEDFDEVEYQLLMQENEFNETLLMAAADLHCELLKTSPEGYMGCLNSLTVNGRSLLKLIVQMTETPITNTDLQIAICMMDDVIEFGGSASTGLYQQFMPIIVKHMENESPDVRQAAVYGIGVFFEVAPPAAVNPQMCNALLKKLNALITAKKSRNKKNVNATENAVSAFGKALEFRAALLENDQAAVATWISYLPVNKDRAEARITYARLVRFILSDRKHIWGENFSLLPNILNVLVQILGSKLVEKELNPQIVAILKKIQSMPPALVQAAVSRLDPELRKKLQSQ